MYSIIVSIIINYILGKLLFYEILAFLVLLFPWGLESPYWKESAICAVFVTVTLLLCIGYNYYRYKRKVKERLRSKITFCITLFIPLFAHTFYVLVLQ